MSNYPEVAINLYVWEQFRLDSLKSASASYLKGFNYNQYKNIVPFFPVSDNTSGRTKWNDKTYVIYDSFLKNRTKYNTFYPIKTSQMIYSINGELEEIFKWKDFIYNILDRDDIAARAVNEYAGQNLNDIQFSFHSINASQSNYIANTTESSGTKKVFSTNLIIKYEYHRTDIYND